ncbi:hypothetical protein CERSUDRAFT_82841 [Gelatoporia subvermispora B]|uniref:Arrestin C-terminal-like domain-containing protein n=1 Tax=Ceriporiopsis subvermispora (strain B) TaxID=914234 RepID=M2R220_CERS8|nr:hypothetical protein CERSUDRAFT_82841 [Gelatoporia subvermispora B]
MDVDSPPSYCTPGSCSPVPIYSETPSRCEHVLQPVVSAPPTARCSYDLVYRSDSLEVNLGKSLWGLKYPAFGKGGTLEGTVQVRKCCKHVVGVTAVLRGIAKTSSIQHARVAVPDIWTKVLLSRTVILFSSADSPIARLAEEFSLDIPFPENADGSDESLPPSFTAYLPGTSCEITYHLQLDIVRRGLRRHETLTIPLLYLPKSRPCSAPLRDIHPPLAPRTASDEHVRVVQIPVIWHPHCCIKARRSSVPQTASILLALPSSTCFPSGDHVPLALTIRAPHLPAFANLLVQNLSLYLVKRKKLYVDNGRRISVREQSLSHAEVLLVGDSQEGHVKIKAQVQTGEAGKEMSFRVDGAVAVEYCIRIVIRSPANVKGPPILRHEEPLQVTTDRFGSLTTELLMMGGIPTPAIGLSDLYRSLR